MCPEFCPGHHGIVDELLKPSPRAPPGLRGHIRIDSKQGDCWAQVPDVLNNGDPLKVKPCKVEGNSRQPRRSDLHRPLGPEAPRGAPADPSAPAEGPAPAPIGEMILRGFTWMLMIGVAAAFAISFGEVLDAL